jgi:hypothetical protein
MLRTAFALTLALGLCACPPSRGGGGGGDDDDGPTSTTGGTAYAWVVIDGTSDASTSHVFMRSNAGSGLCDEVRDYYAAYYGGLSSYNEDTAALSEEFADVPDPSSDSEYRRRSCELLVDFYGSFYSGNLYDEGSEMLSLNLGGPGGEAVEGTHILGEPNPLNPDDDPRFSGTRIRYQGSYVDLLGEVDCVAYANDLDADLFADLGVTDYAEYSTVTDGTLDASPDGDDAWQLILNEAVLTLDETGEEEEIELDASFERCEVEVS